MRSVINPLPVGIADETFRYGTKNQLETAGVFAIARKGDRWLLYSPTLKMFSLAFGAGAAGLSILGFASTDALAECLG
jgi:hypothetical protein